MDEYLQQEAIQETVLEDESCDEESHQERRKATVQVPI